VPEREVPENPAPRGAPHRPHVQSSWLVSAQSVAWTVVASSIAIALGAHDRSAVLGAFGAIGFVDAFGSIALLFHFRHALRHDVLSERLESIAHRVVVTGLLVVGLGAVVIGLARLVAGTKGSSSSAGTALAAISLVVLVILSLRKQRLGRAIASPAMVADGHLSGVGAMQAAVTLFGTGAARWLGWNWADALAATVVGLVAITVAVITWRAERGARARRANNACRR
jgi:divalent metal cation (Fe/Co/Zn/Cd) transporter